MGYYNQAVARERLVNRKCRSGGIGRRAGFRCLWSQDRVGSSPISCIIFLFKLKKTPTNTGSQKSSGFPYFLSNILFHIMIDSPACCIVIVGAVRCTIPGFFQMCIKVYISCPPNRRFHPSIELSDFLIVHKRSSNDSHLVQSWLHRMDILSP